MNLTDDIPRDELLLAQLISTKLGKVIHGFMSVGTACLEMDTPTDFFEGREKTSWAFLEVLRCTGMKPGKTEVVRQQINELSRLTSQFHSDFLKLANWRAITNDEIHAHVESVADDYTQFFQLLGTFGSLLGLNINYADQVQKDIDGLKSTIRMLLADRLGATENGAIVCAGQPNRI